jgi:hypothetical protein
MFPNPMTPKSMMLALYWVVVFSMLVLYSLLLIFVSKEESKKTIVNGVGMRFVLVNWFMAAWAVAWALQSFIASTVFLSLNLLLLIWINLTLLTHPPTSTRPIDTLAIHIPLRLFLVITLLVDLPQSLFITLGWTYPLEHPNRYANYQWEAFGVIMGTNLLGLIIVILNTDVVWAAGGVWCMLAEIARRPKPAPVFISCIVFAVLYPTAWVFALLWGRARRREEGRIVLEGEDEALRHEIARVQAERIVDEQERRVQQNGEDGNAR